MQGLSARYDALFEKRFPRSRLQPETTVGIVFLNRSLLKFLTESHSKGRYCGRLFAVANSWDRVVLVLFELVDGMFVLLNDVQKSYKLQSSRSNFLKEGGNDGLFLIEDGQI